MTTGQKKRTLTVQVISPHYHRDSALENFDEIDSLTRTAGMETVAKLIQHRVDPHPATYIGPGKILEIKQLVNAHQIDLIVLNSLVKPTQIFRLEQEFWKTHPQIRVWDKIDLILEIFDLHTHSQEAKVQIELARIAHLGPRIYGMGGSFLSRQGGGTGTRGIGETNIERMKRHIKDRQTQLRKRLKSFEFRRTAVIDKRHSAHVPSAVLIGYTNAGKSTLFHALTGKDAKAENSLFTTLESKTGKIKTGSPAPILVTDTIGFMSDLPPELLTAFRATLAEALAADLLIHIVDRSDNKYLEKIATTQSILESLGAHQIPQLIVYNKVDRIPNFVSPSPAWHELYISAHNASDISRIKAHIVNTLHSWERRVS